MAGIVSLSYDIVPLWPIARMIYGMPGVEFQEYGAWVWREDAPQRCSMSVYQQRQASATKKLTGTLHPNRRNRSHTSLRQHESYNRFVGLILTSRGGRA